MILSTKSTLSFVLVFGVIGSTTHSQAAHVGSESLERHVKDLGNIRASTHGSGAFPKRESIVKPTGPDCVSGQPVVVHINREDLGYGGDSDCKPCGNITMTAVAQLTVGRVRGLVMFVEYTDRPTWIFGSLSNNPEDGGPFKGFHVHTFPDFSDGYNSTGGHYDPKNAAHVGSESLESHVGDLRNIKARKYGFGAFFKQDSIIKLTGPDSVLRRPVVVHINRNDLGHGGDSDCNVNGNAGTRVGCGLIEPLFFP